MEVCDAEFIQEKVDKVQLDIVFDYALSDSSETENQRKLSVFPEARKILMEHYTTMPGGLESLFQKLHREKINREIGILCLSANPRSILMWSHYADEHKGFVIGFDSDDDFFSHRLGEPEDIGLLRIVDYVNNRPIVVIEKLKNENHDTPDYFFTKNPDWDYEQEWRIIRFLNGAAVVLCGETHKTHLFKVPASAIREVIFGCNAQAQVRETLLATVKENPTLKHVSFFDAALSRSKYEMDILPFPRIK
jgi:hypothetical protein